MITESSSEVPPSAPRGPLPLVGIGASAGGLEPLERFLRNVPVASGIAFIVVQHLDPTHSTMLAELLQRCTLMSVREATEGMRVEADHVYVIPPDRDLAVENGVLRLSTVATPRGFRLPIDFLFASLAAEAGQGAVGIVLSGMGSDGSIGLAAIRAAEFSADVEAMPAMIAARLAAREPLPPRTGPAPAPAQPLTATGPALSDDDVEPTLNADESQAFIRVLARLREQCGHDFSAYKRSTVLRRVERRMSIHHLGTVSAYAALVRDNGPELDLLFKEMLIGVTSFFRDPATWEALRAEVLPALLKARPPNVPIRAWVAGCSTGEEAYTLAILLREALAAADPPITTVPQIFATDLDLDAIVRARIGIYPASIADALTPARLAAHFTPCAGGFRVTRAIRESVVFAPHDVLLEPPFTKLDLLTCRNLLIYLSTELQQQVLATFHYSLRPGGFLLLGSAETVGPATTLFTSLDAKARLYRRLDSGETSRTLTYPVPIIRPPPVPSLTPVPPTDLQTAAEKLLRDRFAPAAVLANEKGDILYVSGRTGRFLEPAAG
jgi:two-component system CheB/CheR fusion protein